MCKSKTQKNLLASNRVSIWALLNIAQMAGFCWVRWVIIRGKLTCQSLSSGCIFVFWFGVDLASAGLPMGPSPGVASNSRRPFLSWIKYFGNWPITVLLLNGDWINTSVENNINLKEWLCHKFKSKLKFFWVAFDSFLSSPE